MATRHPAPLRHRGAWPIDGVDSQHVQIEAMKLAFADTYRYVSDPAGLEFLANACSTMRTCASRARLIDMKRAQAFEPGNPVKGGRST
jgi:gamma-glutamyltranspeptidase/glutathione hydrolase